MVDLDLEKFFDRVNHDVLAEPGAAAGAGPAGGDADPPVPEGRSAHPGGRGGTDGGGDAARRSALAAAGEPAAGRPRQGAGETRAPVRPLRRRREPLRPESAAGERVMASVTRFLERTLRLKVNEAKSAVDRPWNRKFLGFTFTTRQSNRRKVSEKALQAFKAKVRELTGRTRGRTMRQIVQELRQLHPGLAGVLRLRRGDLTTSRSGQVDPTAAPELPLEAMGPARLPGAAEAGHGRRSGLEYGQVGSRAVASESEPGAGDRATAALLRGAGAAEPGEG